ncbi:MAG: hypothetical protein K5647_08090 [Clostridiales bacterium]|nr:hypothetical protein [Clostridiales bacterium]
MENEEYSVKENDALEEYQAYSEFNAESTVSEFQQYAKEGGYAGPEDQDYGKSSSNSGLTRHSSLLRNNRNRLGRMLSILAAMTGPAIAAILIMTTSLFADVRSYKTEPGSLEVTLSLYSSSESTAFSAVLSDMSGKPVKTMAVDRNYPVLYFDGLTPGQIYLLEVFGDDESLLSYSYSIPENPPDPEETGDTDETGGGHGTGEETSEPGPAPAPSVTLFSQEATFNSAVIKLTARNIEISDLKASFNGSETALTADENGRAVISAEGLDPGTEYSFSVADSSGKELCSGTVKTTARTPVRISEKSFSCTLTEAAIDFDITNPDGNRVTAKLDGNDTSFAESDGVISFSLDGLEENSQHTIEFFDWNGDTILTYSFSTRARESAKVVPESESVGIDSVSLSFVITNPDKNPLTVTLDGATLRESLTDDSFGIDLKDLVTGEEHKLEFLDWDGTVLLTHLFAARERIAATIALENFTTDLTTAEGSFTLTNPDGNSITATLDGTDCSFTESDGGISVAFTGLAENASHTLVFYDYDGSTILSYPFTTRARQTASASFTTLQAGFNSISVGVSITNPDGNTLELRRGNTKINTDMTGSTASATLSGLSPRTSYTISVYDVTVGKQVLSQQVTTATSVTVSQDRNGNAIFTLTDEFKSLYPRATLSLTDSLGASIPVTSTTGGFTSAANDFVYSGTYTIKMMSGNSTVDTLTSSLTGRTRPSFSLSHSTYGPATTQEALTSEWHSSSISYPSLNYTLNSGFVETVLADEESFLTGNLRWTALIITDTSGNLVNMYISGIGVEEEHFELSKSGKIENLIFNYGQELDPGNYKAALYTADGYTADAMRELIWPASEENATTEQNQLASIFTTSRKITSDVSFSVTEDVYIGYGSLYETRDPIIDSSSVTRYFSCSYEPPAAGGEGFVTVVSASNPTVQLETVSLGTEEYWGRNIDRFYYATLDPVYVIIYYGTFTPEHFLYVEYMTAN